MAVEGSRWLEPVFCMQYLGGVDHLYRCQDQRSAKTVSIYLHPATTNVQSMLRLFGHIASISANTLSNRGGLTVLVPSFLVQAYSSACGSCPYRQAGAISPMDDYLKHRRVS